MSNRRPCRRLSNSTGGRKPRPSHPTHYTHHRLGTTDWTSRNTKHLQRNYSEPSLSASSSIFDNGKEQGNSEHCLLPCPETCLDIFLLSSPLLPPSPPFQEDKYGIDTKVVVNVTVEGSPGPISAMVRMGASVEETIKIVVDKYEKEGRRPVLGRDASAFVLYSSYFSLEGLNKTDRIGEVGSRIFYLRKSSHRGRREAEEGETLSNTGLGDPIFPMIPPPLFTSFIVRKMMGKISRRTRKLLKLLGCVEGC